MVKVVVCRLPNWQVRVVKKYIKRPAISYSDIHRLALNFFILNWEGKINATVLDETEFKARKASSK